MLPVFNFPEFPANPVEIAVLKTFDLYISGIRSCLRGAVLRDIDGADPGRSSILRTAKTLIGCTSLIIATTGSAQVSPSTETAAPMEAVFWQGAMISARMDYEAQVVRLALEKTREEYGDYTYEIKTHEVTNLRLERDIRDGGVANIVSSPTWHTDSADSVLKPVPIPIVQGLLGYRQLVIRKDNLARFGQVNNLEDLQTMTAGLGNDWVETDIFDHSGLPWFGGKSIDQLYSMLARGRLDYLPLSAIEIDKSLSQSEVKDELTVAPALIIYYPLPVFIQVSVKQPQLAERVELGLKKALKDGTLDALFHEHYGAIVEELQSEEARVITIENPFLPSFVEPAGPTLVTR